jgi:hypothetical protein
VRRLVRLARIRIPICYEKKGPGFPEPFLFAGFVYRTTLSPNAVISSQPEERQPWITCSSGYFLVSFGRLMPTRSVSTTYVPVPHTLELGVQSNGPVQLTIIPLIFLPVLVLVTPPCQSVTSYVSEQGAMTSLKML